MILETIKKEREEIKKMLSNMETLFSEKINYKRIKQAFTNLQTRWFKYQNEENEILKSNIQGKELEDLLLEIKSINGHTKIINKAFETEDRNYIQIVMDTDGRMFVDRLKNRLEKENQMFS